MQNQQYRMQKSQAVLLLKDSLTKFAAYLNGQQFPTQQLHDREIQRYLLNEMIPYLKSCTISLKQFLKDQLIELKSPQKYELLLFLSLIDGNKEKSYLSDIYKLYYQLISLALKTFKQNSNQVDQVSFATKKRIFQKFYQFSLLVHTGNTIMLKYAEGLMQHVNRQLFVQKFTDVRLNRIIKIYNSLLCVPEQYLTLHQILNFTLIFTRWEFSLRDYDGQSFFEVFMLKCQRKIIKKFRRYDPSLFNQEDIMNIVKVVLGGDEMLFSQFIQVVYAYESTKRGQGGDWQKAAKIPLQQLGKSLLNQSGRFLFNFVTEILLVRPEKLQLQESKRQSLLVVILRFLSSKFENNEALYIVLIGNLIRQNNSVIVYLILKNIQEETLRYLTVNKVKLLLNTLNFAKIKSGSSLSESSIEKQKEAEIGLINKLQRIVWLLKRISEKFNETSMILIFGKGQNQSKLKIDNVKNVSSLFFVVDFHSLNTIKEELQMKVLTICIDKSRFYQLIIRFSPILQDEDSLQMFEKGKIKEFPRQRVARVIIRSRQHELVNQKKQYLHFNHGQTYQSFISVLLTRGKDESVLTFSIDGAFYEIHQKKKVQITRIEIGPFVGSARSFNAFKSELNLVNLFKSWWESHRKANLVAKSLGHENIVYRMSSSGQDLLLDSNFNIGFTFFQKKTQFSLRGVTRVRNITLVQILHQLGGLETIFFLMERLSKSFMEFRHTQTEINILFSEIFIFLKQLAISDQNSLFLNYIVESFQYFNQFLYLIVKRNRIISQNKNSTLFLSIFQFLLFFRSQNYRHHRFLTPELSDKIRVIETNLILKTLCNFQIWSSCSSNLQLFVLNQIQRFIRQGKYLAILIKHDLHRQIISSIILFQIGPAAHTQINPKLAEICYLLYQNSQQYLVSAEKFRQLVGGNLSRKDELEPFLQRDLNTCLSLLHVVLKSKKKEIYSLSERSAVETLCKYLIQNFVLRRKIFDQINKDWNFVLFTMCSAVQGLDKYDYIVIQKLTGVVLSVVSMSQKYQPWIVKFMNPILNNPIILFTVSFNILCRLMEKYPFQTLGKQLIICHLIQGVGKKMEEALSIDEILEFKNTLNEISPQAFYQLSTYLFFAHLLEEIKFRIFTKRDMGKLPKIQKQQYEMKVKLWVQINEQMLQLLFRNRKFTILNQKFVGLIFANIHQFKGNPTLRDFTVQNALHFPNKISEFIKKSAQNVDNRFYKFHGDRLICLIEQSASPYLLYFLIEHNLLTFQPDISVPFDKDMSYELDGQFLGGTFTYYLTLPTTPFELNVLFLFFKERMNLEGGFSIIRTLSIIILLQNCLKRLCSSFWKSQSDSKVQRTSQKQTNVRLIVKLLKEVVKLADLTYLLKATFVSKEIDKMVLQLPKRTRQNNASKRLKEISIFSQALDKLSEKVAISLSEGTIDTDIASLFSKIQSKVFQVDETDQQGGWMESVERFISELSELDQLNEQIKKMSFIASFQINLLRDIYLLKFQTAEEVKSRKSEILSEYMSEKQQQLGQQYLSLLTQKFDSILYNLSSRSKHSQAVWQNLLIKNESWLDLQAQDVDDVTNKFYEMDEKETGPFGFYKLNIRPIKKRLEQVPYPRRKEYLEMVSKQRNEPEEEQINELELPILHSRKTITQEQVLQTTFYSSLVQSKNQSNFSKSIPQMTKQKSSGEKRGQKEYFCQYITKRGVYAGKLRIRRNQLEFLFLGHDKLPPGREYEISTNKCHKIVNLSEWEIKQLQCLRINLSNSKVFTRRYIMRHTAFEIFQESRHLSYLFNLFFTSHLQGILKDIQDKVDQCIFNRPQEFKKRGYIEKWQKGQISNFQYICLINRFSGRSCNDLSQYPVMPWVISNYDGANGFTQLDKQFLKNPNNLRDLQLPTGKLNQGKFQKLKRRLQEVDISQRQIRFLYGTMYSNPTLLYNFFIRLQPFTSLHWEHQGKRIDHADRLFSGIAEQYSTLLSSSSDMKELTPEFYYWPEFLKNRNRIDLGFKQNLEQVNDIRLPVWASTPYQFIFRMREVLESNYVSSHLHSWIDLIFGYKNPYDVAQEYDNLYHIKCYEHDLFKEYETENQMKITQISISQFGQIPQQIFFDDEHPKRNLRRDIEIDMFFLISRCKKNKKWKGFEVNQMGLLLWEDEEVQFKKSTINGIYLCYDWSEIYPNKGKNCTLVNFAQQKWLSLSKGVLRVYEKKKIRLQKDIESSCYDFLGSFLFYGCQSKLVVKKVTSQYELQNYGVLYGHKDNIILIKTQYCLDLIVSVDKTGYVIVHELTEMRFLRAFHINSPLLTSEDISQLRLCIHQMGYFIFFDRQQTLTIFKQFIRINIVTSDKLYWNKIWRSNGE